MRAYRRWAVLFILWTLSLPALAATSASINVNAAVTLTTFNPKTFFGNNVAFWISKADNLVVQPKVQAAGNYLLRYPGGSASDDYHWNGTGVYDSNGWWVPSNAVFTRGWTGNETYRGTTSSYGAPSKLTDGNVASSWMSHPITDNPNAQWVYVDLRTARTATGVSIIWGTPYATQFKIQYWNSGAGWPQPYESNGNLWVDTSAGTVAGAGGTQTVVFTAQTRRWFRILMTGSSVSPAQYAIREVYVLNGAVTVSVHTTDPSTQSPGVVSSTDPAATASWTPDFDFESYMVYCRSFSPQAIPLLTANFGTGTPQEAAAWVHYANVVKGYGIKYWEVGNELNGDWETGGPLSAKDYARRYIDFYEAMKAEDPSIMVLGPVANTPYVYSGDYDGKRYIRGFVDRLAADGKASYVEGLAFHWYAWWQNDNEATSLDTPSQVAGLAATDLPAMLVNHPSPATVPVFLSEFNSGNATNLSVRLMNGLWMVNWMGEWIKAFGPRAYLQVWDVLNGGDAVSSLTGGDHAYLQVENNAYRYQERAHYWTMQMMAARWAMPGDETPHGLLSAVSNQYLLPAYAARRPDGAVALLVVNKDPSVSYAATLTLAGFTPNASARRWTFDSTNYAWNTSSLPYHASPDLPPTEGVQTGVQTGMVYTFPPYSVTVFQFSDLLIPTPTASLTPTATLTATPTATRTPTFTRTATRTRTATNTRTSTRTSTPTRTSTDTFTPTDTATETWTGTSTSSPTESSTPTESCSPTDTGTPTETTTETWTGTPTPSPTESLTPTQTCSSTDTETPTDTATETWTVTLSPTSTWSVTPTDTGSPTLTETPTETPTETWTDTPTWTDTFTPTWTVSSTTTLTPTATSSLQVLAPILWPNPVKTGDEVNLRLTIPADGKVRIRMITTSFRVIRDTGWQDRPVGVNDLVLSLVDGDGAPLSNGLYYLAVETGPERRILKMPIQR